MRAAWDSMRDRLDQWTRSHVPGLQYVVVDAKETLFEYAGGWADVRNQTAMTLDATLMAYSMTKTVTAVAILQLAEKNALGLDDRVERFLPFYCRYPITVRQLLDHTSGLPNPIPLRWVHLVEEDAGFDEDAALARVVRANPSPRTEPGQKFAYSNIGYWLLGKIVERAAAISYTDYVRMHILGPLNLSAVEMDFVIRHPEAHATGYLARYSLMNLLKRFVIDRRYWDGYDGRWLRLNPVYVDGPAFGGLVGGARGFRRILQDQLASDSVLLCRKSREILETRQTNGAGHPIPMTLGWHVGQSDGVNYFFKEGGGGGFHSEMRLYPTAAVGSVVMVNSTGFKSTPFLNRMDGAFVKGDLRGHTGS